MSPRWTPPKRWARRTCATEIEGFPEVSEVEAIRHFTRLSTWNYAIDYGMYPLGSCTMKYNPRINEAGGAHRRPGVGASVSAGSAVAGLHGGHGDAWKRRWPRSAGMDAVTLQPAAGAHGELTGILLIRALLEKRGNPRKKILIPDSAHGTNPATAAIAGYAVENIKSSETGGVDLGALEQLVTSDVAALMVTNPNTLGVFENNIVRVAEILHKKGAMLYMDGANMNALVGIARPGDFGVDVMHLNLHKTFSTPHGGGGPGAGPVAVKKVLEPFLPTPRLKRSGKKLAFDYKRKHSIGRVKAFYGNFGVLVRALAYILAHGGPGLRNATMDAVLNADLHPQGAGALLRPALPIAQHARGGVQRRPAGETRRAHRRYRQAPDRLRLPPVHRELPDDRPRRAHDRADRDRRQARNRQLHRRHDLDRARRSRPTRRW